MSFNVTQCPTCESTFNTNSHVLAAAAGKVRCGACLNVFEAIDNFLIPEEADAALDQGESVFVGNDPQAFFDPSSFLTRSALSETHDDEPIDKQNLHQELEKSETVSEDFFVTEAEELQGRAEAPALENGYKDEDPPIDQPELMQAGVANDNTTTEFEDKILDFFVAQITDAHELTEHYPADSSLEEPIEPEPKLTDAKETHIKGKQPFLGLGQSTSFFFDPNALPQAHIGTPKVESPPDQETASESVAEDEEPTIEATQTSARVIDEDSTQAIRARALEAELSDEEALEAIPRENLAALESMSAPVELLARKESRLLRSTLLFLSILLLGGLLSSQYLWQRMELYSQLPQLRPLYEVACTFLNCALPQYADIDSIRSENLTVQTHPTLAKGLMVNTVIRNSAEFEQPFPILILSFNSVENSSIALREFTSAEYLDPGLRSIQAMPAKTPVQIRLAIMDPGPEAVNYTLAFRWP